MSTTSNVGPTDLYLGAKPPDAGTNNPNYTAPPGHAGGHPPAVDLNPADRADLDRNAGRDIAGKPFTLPRLRQSRDTVARSYRDTVSQCDTPKIRAYYDYWLAILDEMIAEAESGPGQKATELDALLDDAEKRGGKVDEDAVRKKFVEMLGALRKQEERHPGSGMSAEAGAVMKRAMDVVAKQKLDAAEQIVKAAKAADSTVSDDELSKVVSEPLGIERQRQLLGMAEDGDPDSARTMQIVAEVITIGKDRAKKKLTRLVEDAKRPDSKVTDAQFQEAVIRVLGGERQSQLLGLSTDDDSSLAVLGQAIEVWHRRHATELKSLVTEFKQPGSKVTRAQLQQCVVKILGDARQAALMGAGERADADLDAALSEAVRLLGGSDRVEPPAPPTTTAPTVMRMDPLHVAGRNRGR